MSNLANRKAVPRDFAGFSGVLGLVMDGIALGEETRAVGAEERLKDSAWSRSKLTDWVLKIAQRISHEQRCQTSLNCGMEYPAQQQIKVYKDLENNQQQ